MNKAFNLNKFKKEATQLDFRNVDVRRLNGILLDFKDNSSKALEEMEKWLANGDINVSFEEAQDRLSYYLSMLGLGR